MEIINSYYLLTKDKGNKFDIVTELSQFFTPVELEENTLYIEPIKNDVYIPFEYKYKSVVYKAKYLLAYKNIARNNVKDFYFEVKLFYEQKKSGMEALSNIIRELKIYFSKHYYMVALEDSVSKYYNQLAYKYTSEYERKIRKLILVTLVPEFKADWVRQLPEHSKRLKGNSSVELGLEELDLSHLEEILFTPKLTIDVENYNEIFDKKNIRNMNQIELVELIQSNAPKSFWEIYLSKYVESVDLKSRMEGIRSERNKVAHHKSFTEEKYKKLKKDVTYVNRIIDEAIKLVISSDTRLDISGMNKNIVESLNNLSKSMTKYIKLVNESEVIKNAAIAVTNFVDSDGYKNIVKMQNNFTEQISKALIENKDNNF
ncbi:hypothetical protein [Vagococcus fluvialis]|uniref:hypothetical protein n=1 Tax=Vagococcus fluvialis TaxID=2738 RepID=UPI002B2C2293|nr:hypothetical protein QDW48_06445 [Vagococcus fluvialis]